MSLEGEAWFQRKMSLTRRFPFRIIGFGADNSREFIHRTVAQLPEKLRIEQTKSRPRRSKEIRPASARKCVWRATAHGYHATFRQEHAPPSV